MIKLTVVKGNCQPDYGQKSAGRKSCRTRRPFRAGVSRSRQAPQKRSQSLAILVIFHINIRTAASPVHVKANIPTV
jgi:hypothetical protein